ncbi:hypothetical protein ACFSTI_22375 [Rhizorhabdus histidinilytica]
MPPGKVAGQDRERELAAREARERTASKRRRKASEEMFSPVPSESEAAAQARALHLNGAA